jgi:DNA-directed RNA polymerase subunit RPC12/RpoP
MDDKIVTLRSYYDAMEAEIVRGRLEANDIPCFIADDNVLSSNPIYNQAIGGVKLKVFEHDVVRCSEILAEETILNIGDELMTCPNCRSTNVYHGPAPIKRNWFYVALGAFFAGFPFYYNRTWNCMDCGADFESTEK